MDNNNIDSELNDDFIYKIIKMISELYDAENLLNYIILNNKLKKTESFVIFDKAWLEKWKIIVGYEELKEKCFKCKSDEEKKKLIGEVRELFIKLNTKEKLDELGMMNSNNLQKTIGKNKFINEESNFLPVLAHQCAYFMKSINSPITINSEISNGIIYIQNPFPEKNKEQKLILLNKNEYSDDFIRHVITLEPNVKVKDVVKELKKKNINEIMNQKEFKLELIKPIVITESKESEYKRKEAEYKRKEAEWKRKEAEWKRKEAEWKREEAEWKREETKWKREETKWKREETEWKRKDPEWKRKEEERKRKEAERKRKEEEEEREKKEAERKRKEAEEAERKRKEEEEEEERKKKEAEDLKKRKELQEKLKKEEEERKRKEEEEKKQKELQEKLKKEEEDKKQKELQEKLKKEEEDKKKKEEEEEERRKKQIQDEMKKNEVDEKIRKERERPVNKKFENEKIKNNLADAIKKQIVFDENIKKKGEIQDENFLIRCSVVNKDWYEKFLKLSNYDSIKQNLSQSPNNVDQAINNALNDKDFKIEEIKNFVKNKPQLITDKGLENIENLAFVDDEFAAKVLSLGENNDNNNIYSNVDNQNKNVINKNQILPKSHTKIMINNGSAIIQLSNQKYVCANINDSNLNKRDNIEVIDFFENKNFDLFKEIKSNPKVGLRQAVKEKYISNIRPKEGKKIELNVIRQKEEKKEKERLEKEKKDKEQREKEEREKKERDEKEKKERINLDNRDYSLGLDNVGATCFMNATLQCLAHIKRITEYVLNYRRLGKLKDIKQYRLSDAYSEVLWEIWLPQDKSKKSFSPNRFKEVLGEMNSLFAPTAANDAKDLLIYFIEQMHNELNQTEETNTNLVMPDNMNPMNHQEVLECFIREFSKKYKSVFSNYCYGSNVSMTFCNGCRITKYSYQCFSFIIFPLLEAKKNCVTSGRLHPMLYNNYVLNIEDCFLYNQKLEFFTGDNQMYCNICQASKDSSMQTKISAAPLVLILILNRGRGNLDFREPFTFWEIIDLTNYVEFPQPDNKYFLSGVVSYMGESGPSGHYIAYCRMSPNSKYYCYNDSLVNESSFEEINRRGTPYILFYQKCVIVA